MATITPWYDNYRLTFGADGGAIASDVRDAVTRISLSYTMDMASQLSIEIVDRDYVMGDAGYFQLRREVYLQDVRANKTSTFEIAAVTYAAGESDNLPVVRLECRTAAIQQMKRDKRQESFRQMSAGEFASIIAERHGLQIFGQSTSKIQSIVKSRSQNSDESVWDILNRLANDNQYVVFESDGVLYFCSQPFLLGKIGDGSVGIDLVQAPDWPGQNITSGAEGQAVAILQQYLGVPVDGKYGKVTIDAVKKYERANGFAVDGVVDKPLWDDFFATVGRNYKFVQMTYPSSNVDGFQILSMPEVRRSDDDPFEADGSLECAKPNGRLLRPGMTIGLRTPNRYLNGAYLITAVDFDLHGPEPVRVEFRTPAALTPENN